MELGELLYNNPDGDPKASLVLAHGAGAPMDTPFMNRIASGLASRGVRVVRFEFPYMQKRREDGKRRGPDRPAVLESSWKAVIEELGSGAPLSIGGKSMGGRIASMVADECQVQGLVCLGYPFHPPGRPGSLRTAHLKRLKTPTLIVQGERDSFGTRQEVAQFELAKQIRFAWMPDGDHSFKPRKSSGHTLEKNLDDAIEAATGFLLAL